MNLRNYHWNALCFTIAFTFPVVIYAPGSYILASIPKFILMLSGSKPYECHAFLAKSLGPFNKSSL